MLEAILEEESGDILFRFLVKSSSKVPLLAFVFDSEHAISGQASNVRLEEEEEE